MSHQQFLTWANFRTTICIAGEQRLHVVSQDPFVAVFSDDLRGCIGLWLGVSAPLENLEELPRLAHVYVRNHVNSYGFVLELSVLDKDLFGSFYHFAAAISGRIVDGGLAPLDAICAEMESATDLLRYDPVLSVERQVGLIGELLVLRRIASSAGCSVAVESWAGPIAEPHDFRIGGVEYEVKTTTMPTRGHYIHGLVQLVPTVSHRLHLVSVVLAPAAADDGFSLSDCVESVRGAIGPAVRCDLEFEKRLNKAGYNEEDRSLYPMRYVLRRPLGWVAVPEGVPALTEQCLTEMFGHEAPRFSNVRYMLNIEGLVCEDGSPEFARDFPY